MLKIGVFDSGLGGLTVVQSLSQVIKGAEIFYIADTLNAPYGEKNTEEILQYSLDLTNYFITYHKIDTLVVACNTATSAAIKVLRQKYPNLIIVGTEPGIKPAIEQTLTGNVGVLATPATLKGDKYQQLASSLSLKKKVNLYEQACPGLVDQIEKGEINSLKTKEMLELWLAPMHENNVDTIVLGCTHYPLASTIIEKIMQKKLTLIHTGDAIAQHLLTLANEIGHNNEGKLKLHIFYTGKLNDIFVHDLLHNIDTLEKIKIR